MNKINWELVITKFADLSRFLTEKQTWFKFIFPIIFALGILPYINEENANVLSEQAVVWTQVIISLVASILLGFSKNPKAVEKADSDMEKLIKTLEEWVK